MGQRFACHRVVLLFLQKLFRSVRSQVQNASHIFYHWLVFVQICKLKNVTLISEPRPSFAACIHVDFPDTPDISAVGMQLQQTCLLLLEPRLLGGSNLVHSDLDRQEYSGTTLEHIRKTCLAHSDFVLHRTGPGAQLPSLAAWHQKQSLQGPQAVINKHKQQSDRDLNWLLTAGAAAAGVAAAGVAAAGVGLQAHCESSSYAAEQVTSSRWSKLLKRVDPRQLLHAREQNAFLEEMQADPKVS